MLLFYFLKFYPTFSLLDFFRTLAENKTLITGLISFSLFANAVVFTVYINTRRDRTARGIFVITCVYAIITIALKFFLR